MMIDNQKLSELLEEAQKFGETKFPPLAEKVRQARIAIYKAYIQNGKPFGEGKDNALLWFNSQYEAWKEGQEGFQERLQEYQATVQQLEMVGDMLREQPTTKGLARSLMLMLFVYVTQADTEGRGLTTQEEVSISHFLLLLLAHFKP